MWNRTDLKQKGKAAFLRNYWYCVLVALVLGLLAGGASTSARSNYSPEQTMQAAQNSGISSSQLGVLSLAAGVIGVNVAFASMFLKWLVFNVLEVGGASFFFRNTLGPAPMDELLRGFREGYGRNFLTMLLRDVFIFLWTLLLFIPGIVKAYSYRLVPYILADNPDLSWREALDLSQTLMDGNKWNAFLLDLSFFGWYLLNIFTVGVAGLFFVNPYKRATDAELYRVLRYTNCM